jgi:hypothetical protein
MRWLTVGLVFFSTLGFASHCPDPNLRQAVIGGDAINGFVVLHGKPMKFARMRLYSSSGKTTWVGLADRDGGFAIRHQPPDTYHLTVCGWGSATIRLDSTLTKLPNGQTPIWAVELMDNECVGYSESVD